MSRVAALCCVGLWLGATVAAWAAEKPRPTPIILDTDIGTEIDDALALGLVLTSPELELRGVTTVDGDAYTRALIVCRLLDVLERGKIPVASGAPPRKVPDFSGQMQYGLRPAHKRPVKESAVEFLAAQLKAAPGELTILCIGPLTNIAGLLEKHPEAAKQIKRLVIMGGSIKLGYNGKPPAGEEWNIKSDIKAAQRVFASGLPITLLPLDATATLNVDEAARKTVFTADTVVSGHLHGLYQLWGKETPVLYDPAAVAALIQESLFNFETSSIEVDDRGVTRTGRGSPRVRIAMSTRPGDFFAWYLARAALPVLDSGDFAKCRRVALTAREKIMLQGNRLTLEKLGELAGEGRELMKESDDFEIRADRTTKVAKLMEIVRTLQARNVRKFHFSVAHAKATSVSAKGGTTRVFPNRVHVVENYQTEIEGRWWLAGIPQRDESVTGNRACRAVLCNDFDDLQGDKYGAYKTVIFNPVPGPPMGKHTMLGFRYRLLGATSFRVQIYSLTKGYHRQLTVTDLEQGAWAEAAADLTQARRPDGTGGPLSEDERIDDIQFYADPAAELFIDDIVLYDAADEATRLTAKRPFPKQVVFTGWFDTGKQGVEWPGDFEIVPHKPPLTWKAAKAVPTSDGKSPWIRVDLRGPRPLPSETRLRFRYFVRGAKKIGVELGVAGDERRTAPTSLDAREDAWAEADLDLTPSIKRTIAERKPPMAFDARDIVFRAAGAKELLVDDVLLYEPGK